MSEESVPTALSAGVGPVDAGAPVEERVYAAAEKISAERNPTVSSVREAAGVSNADATRYLRKWREEKAAAGSRIVATPQAVLEQAARLAGSVWADAVALAADQHAVVEAQWARDSRDKDTELAELVADLDKVTTDHAAEVTGLRAELAAATDRAGAAESRATQTEEAAATAHAEISTLTSDLAAARARAETLQHAHDALIQRITPEKTTQQPRQ